MTISLNNLKPFQVKKKRKTIGRGNASGHGSYSTRGQKGQKSRSGGRRGLKIMSLRRVWKKIPKQGGFRSPQVKMRVINLELLDKNFSEEKEINPKSLFDKGFIKKIEEKYKILGNNLKKKLTISAHAFSKSAEEAIKKNGGTVIRL